MTITVRQATSDEDIARALEIRRKVFIDGQGVPEEHEVDEYEKGSLHFLVEEAGKPIATGRLRQKKSYIKFERIAVLPGNQSKGVGRLLMEKMTEVAFAQFPHLLPAMHAQTQAAAFYDKLGWLPVGETFMEADIEHRVYILPPDSQQKFDALHCLSDPETNPEILRVLKRI